MCFVFSRQAAVSTAIIFTLQKFAIADSTREMDKGVISDTIATTGLSSRGKILNAFIIVSLILDNYRSIAIGFNLVTYVVTGKEVVFKWWGF